jgi:hypothetical protein
MGLLDLDLVLMCLDLCAVAHDMRPLSRQYMTLIDSRGEDALYRPRFLAVSRGADLYIMVRGSTELGDFTTGLEFNPTPFLGDSRAHRGALLSAEWLLEQCHDIIAASAGRVIVSGHSFGAAVAAIAATILRVGENDSRASAVLFGSLPSMSADIAGRTHDFIATFVFDQDPVTRMTPQNLKAATAALVKLDQDNPGAFGPVLHRYGEVCLDPIEAGSFLESNLNIKSDGVAKNIMRDAILAGEHNLVNPGTVWCISVSEPQPPTFVQWVEGQKINGWTDIIENMRNHKYSRYLRIMEGSADVLWAPRPPDT